MDVVEYSQEQEIELLNKGEGHFVEFKRSEIAPGKLQQTFCAFANADGGEIYVGLDDDENLTPTLRISGFRKIEAANNHVSIAESLLDPRLLGVTLEFIRLPSKKSDLVLHAIVPKSDKVHYTSDGECFKRHSAQNLKIRGKDVENLVFSKGQRSFEDTFADGIAANEFNKSEYLKQYLSLVPTAQPAMSFLRKQRLIEQTPGKSLSKARVRTAAVLLFDDEPQAALSTRSGVKVTRYQATSEKYDRRQIFGAPIAIEGPTDLLIKRSVAKIEEIMNSSYFRIKGRYRKVTYPAAAIHEIVTNAILHRDYSLKDDIHIAIYDNRIEVISPGRLPGHITPKNILEERFMRNPKMVRLVNKLPDPPNRDIGEGLNTAFREMQNARLKPPEIEELESAVKVTLLHEALASPDQQIVEHLKKHGVIQNKTARDLTGRESMQSIYKVFLRLIAASVIELVDPSTNVYERKYRLTANWRRHWEQKKGRTKT